MQYNIPTMVASFLWALALPLARASILTSLTPVNHQDLERMTASNNKRSVHDNFRNLIEGRMTLEECKDDEIFSCLLFGADTLLEGSCGILSERSDDWCNYGDSGPLCCGLSGSDCCDLSTKGIIIIVAVGVGIISFITLLCCSCCTGCPLYPKLCCSPSQSATTAAPSSQCDKADGSFPETEQPSAARADAASTLHKKDLADEEEIEC